MQKEMLIAVDDSAHSMSAVEYAASMPGVIKELHFTLYHVQPAVSLYIIDEAEKNPQARAKLAEILKRNQGAADTILALFKNKMIEAVIDEDRISLVSRPRMHGIAKDILAYGLTGSFDAIVVGRRGMSKMQELFMGSVTNKIIDHSEVTPVWIVDKNEDHRKIMIAVDGSESSLRAVDHVSFMLKDNTDVEITLLHVKPRIGDTHVIEFDLDDSDLCDIVLDGEQQRVTNFFSCAKDIFRDHGLSEGQLKVREVKCTANIGKTIISEVRKGNFGTLVVGRSGVNKSFFFGSVSRYVLNTDTKASVWLVP
jgi:nucleotide-binding universal stress UspA family protein